MLKSGYKTTEFLVVVLANVGALAAALSSALPAKWAAIVAVVSSSAYAISRGLAKLSPPPVAVTPVQAPAVTPAPPAGS